MSEPFPTLEVALRDQSLASIRPIQPEDRDLIAEGLASMSMDSRFARFGAAIDHLSKSELDYLTRIDHVDHVAWGATVDGTPAATGRYIKPSGGTEAEMAVAVVDRFQNLGIGRLLFDALVASARHNGLDHLYFVVEPSNKIVLRMLRDVRLRVEQEEEDGLIVAHLAVADIGRQPRDDDFVRLLELAQARS